MLTRKQQELLLYIHQHVLRDGVPPSFEEMKEALNLKSKSGIHRLISALEERGFIRRLPNRARALEIVKMPEALMKQGATPLHALHPPVDLGFYNRNGGSAAGVATIGRAINRIPPDSHALSLPVMGRIAAGVPISAIQDHTHDVSVPPEMVGPGSHFALTVSGDSMIEAGIHDGDTVIIRQTDSAEIGDIVVALVDDEEATLKRFRRKGQEIALEAANSAFETRILTSDRVKVQGRLVGLLRSY
jgi:repressor LexA